VRTGEIGGLDLRCDPFRRDLSKSGRNWGQIYFWKRGGIGLQIDLSPIAMMLDRLTQTPEWVYRHHSEEIVLTQTEERQHRKDDNNQANDIDNVSHGFLIVRMIESYGLLSYNFMAGAPSDERARFL
jgi:hypothetical protein